MGYANLDQIGNGIHFRQYSRAFIVADIMNNNRVVFICADIALASQIVKIEVCTTHRKTIQNNKYFFFTGSKKIAESLWNVYTKNNVLITGIHTHSGPAGFLQYVLYEVMPQLHSYSKHQFPDTALFQITHLLRSHP